jgi:LmbE family N-acetylglucosaminyl deacetylase
MAPASQGAAAALLSALGAPAGERGDPLPPTMVVAAHPDDECVAAGSRLPRLAHAQFVYLTDGAPADGGDAAAQGLSVGEYACRRRQELEQALALCGIRPVQVLQLPCPDQQAAARLVELTRTLARLFLRLAPAAVLTHPYEGGHPDHDASAFAVHAAARLLRRDGLPAPAVVEMACYHQGSHGIRPCTFLPAGDEEAVTVQLTPEEQRRKRALFQCFATQQRTLRQFPLELERFRRSPAYDFRQAPHEGQLFYESFPWGMTGERFRELAAEAIAELALEGRP